MFRGSLVGGGGGQPENALQVYHLIFLFSSKCLGEVINYLFLTDLHGMIFIIGMRGFISVQLLPTR